MDLYNSLPPVRESWQEKPTLLYSWFCTIFASVIILFRCSGRLVRNNKLFREDKIMLLANIPLLVRMAFIHVVLIFGTTGADLSDVTDPTDLHRRSIGSRLVLAARVFYALYIWTAKFTVLDFLKRLTSRFWKSSFELAMRCITGYLVVAFIAVVLSTIVECVPITHYWQARPSSGYQCTQAYVQLVTMATADITTDLLIVFFPIPVIIDSAMPMGKKFRLCLLFSLSLVLVAVTAVRVPSVISHHGQQQYRTVWASSEILAASFVANTIVIGSFLRDRGIKKAKYKTGSQTDSVLDRTNTRKTTITSAQWGSDQDLVAEMGYRLDPELCLGVTPRPARAVEPAVSPSEVAPVSSKDWQFPNGMDDSGEASEDSSLKIEKINDAQGLRGALSPSSPVETPLISPRNVSIAPRISEASFFDIGGLLSNGPEHSRRSSSTVVAGAPPSTLMSLAEQPDSQAPQGRRGSRTLIAEISGLLKPNRGPREQELRAQQSLQDMKGSQASSHSNLAPPSQGSRSHSRSRSKSPRKDKTPRQQPTSHPPTGVPTPTITTRLAREQTLQDIGGLLSADPGARQELLDVGGLLEADPHTLQDVGGLLGGPSSSSFAARRSTQRPAVPPELAPPNSPRATSPNYSRPRPQRSRSSQT